MTRHRHLDPSFDPEEIEENDPLGEDAFEAQGFEDGPDGGPAFSAPGLEDHAEKRPGGAGQKVAGIPEKDQHRMNSASEQHPDSGNAVVRERGGDDKGDPAVGGTRARDLPRDV
jgi:hypothetical protein